MLIFSFAYFMIIIWQIAQLKIMTSIRATSNIQRMYNINIYFNSQDMQQQTALKLSTGDQMPLVGFGTWKVPKQQCPQIVYGALKAGYKLLDCACDYGNQHKVGQGIKKAFDQGVISRKQLFVTSKLWNTFHRPEHVEAACRRSLTDLGLEYLDLYLIHFPISLKYVDPSTRYPPEWLYDDKSPKTGMIEDNVPIIDTWKAMEQLVKKGLVRNIGISNFGVSLLRDLLNSCEIRPSVLQVQLHPYLTQKKLIRFCRANNIQITSYSSLGANSYFELGMAKQQQSLTENQIIAKIAESHKKSAAQVLLKWSVQQGIAIIPKTSKVDRLKQNSDMFEWNLSEEEMKQIDGLNRNRRYNDPGVFCELAFNTYFPIYQ